MGRGAAGIEGYLFFGDGAEKFFFLGQAVVEAQLFFLGNFNGIRLFGGKKRRTEIFLAAVRLSKWRKRLPNAESLRFS